MVKFEEKTIFNNDNYDFKLTAFNVYNGTTSFPNADNVELTEGMAAASMEDDELPTFRVQMFGINDRGETASIIAENFAPFFYVRVPDNWTTTHKAEFLLHIRLKMGNYNKDALLVPDCKIIKRRDFYGFDAGREYKFLQLVFANMTAFNKVKNFWYTPTEDGQRLTPSGYKYGSAHLKIYESNIPPILRMFHIKDISPSGWIRIPTKKTTYRGSRQFTFCDYEFCINHHDIIPLKNKDTPVPYKSVSFDIEASSSHGKFPLPKKSYKLLAENIYDYFASAGVATAIEKYKTTAALREFYKAEFTAILLHAFGVTQRPAFGTKIGESIIEPVFPKRAAEPPTARQVKEWAKKIVSINGTKGRTLISSKKNTIDELFERFAAAEARFDRAAATDDAAENNDLSPDDNVFCEDYDDTTVTAAQHMSAFPEEELAYSGNDVITNDSDSALLDIIGAITASQLQQQHGPKTRLVAINDISRLLSTDILPPLEGDKVTFIGSTVMRYGQKEPYMQHVCVLGTCADMPDTPTGVVETFATERELLLGWTAFMQRENPDIVYGYNTDGFDWEFLYHRADELNCLDEFLQLGRNRGEICTGDSRTAAAAGGKYCLSETNLRIATGDYLMKYIAMTGRMQFDLYLWFRREHNLDSYKLDDVAGHGISDDATQLVYDAATNTTTIHTKNMTGLTVGSYIHIKEVGNSANYYNGGEKFPVVAINPATATFVIAGNPTPDADKLLKWGLAKDDITYKELFELSNGSDTDRAIVAKYCAQDCNLVHYLINKNDIITDYVEMSNICHVPISFLVTRGQSIKLLSLLAKFCTQRKTLIPVIEKKMDGGYEGAIVLPPKCGFYADNPIAVNDFNSLYPSSMISENISHDSKVWTREYDLEGRLIRETGAKDETGAFMYDGLEGYDYVDITYDTYKWERDPKKPTKKPTKRKCGIKICRYAQFPDGHKAIIPAVLEVLLGARKSTRAAQKKVKGVDPSRWQVLEVRQLNFKKCANSIYGQCGASTSPFCDKDVAASTTAIGRLNITYAKRIIEEVYNTKGSPEGVFCESAVALNKWGEPGIISHAEYIYGDTDSIFYTFNMTRQDGTPIKGPDALEITIELAQQVGDLASSFLKCPHNWEYEKTFMPFCLLSKKRYVGMLYEMDPTKGKRKEMGIVLRRRDNAPIVKDVYGGIIDILLKKKDIMKAADFLRAQLREIADERIPMKKLIITKQLRSSYAHPEQIAHKVLADRIGEREPGNRPKPGDRIDYVYIQNTRADALQGDKIENPGFISRSAGAVKIDYAHYITNQIMKPVQQVFALVLEDIWRTQGKQAKLAAHKRDLAAVANRVRAEAPAVGGHTTKDDRREWIETKTDERVEKLKNDEVYHLLFESFVRDLTNKKLGNQPITAFFQKREVLDAPAATTAPTTKTKIVRQKKRILLD